MPLRSAHMKAVAVSIESKLLGIIFVDPIGYEAIGGRGHRPIGHFRNPGCEIDDSAHIARTKRSPSHDSLLAMKECPRTGELYRVRFHEQAAYQGNSQITRHDPELGIIPLMPI